MLIIYNRQWTSVSDTLHCKNNPLPWLQLLLVKQSYKLQSPKYFIVIFKKISSPYCTLLRVCLHLLKPVTWSKFKVSCQLPNDYGCKTLRFVLFHITWWNNLLAVNFNQAFEKRIWTVSMTRYMSPNNNIDSYSIEWDALRLRHGDWKSSLIYKLAIIKFTYENWVQFQ